MTDPRIIEYKRAAEKMAGGDFRVQLPVLQSGDDVDQLGLSLIDLGEKLDLRFEEIKKFAKVTEKINAGLLLDEVLDCVYDEFRTIIPYDRIGVSLLESRNTVVRARWAKSAAPRMEITRGYSARMKGSSLQGILDTGMPRILNDLEAYLAGHPDSESTRRIVQEGMRSSLTCPLIALNKPIGFIFFSSLQKNTYRDLHIDLFLRIASHLSVILEKSRIYEELLELNEMEARFLGMAAHDLRNPLCVLQAYLGILVNDGHGTFTQDQMTALSLMDKACDNMLDIINTFLDISAIESGKLKLKRIPVQLTPFLAEVEKNARVLFSAKNIRFRVEIRDEVKEWIFDPYRIGQVLQNLISNALKFSEPGTETLLRVVVCDGQLELAVCDQGRGIPEEEISLLFKDYGQTSVRPTHGEPSAGLGLAISRRIVEAHEGTLGVESRLGHGSVFTVALPRMPGPPPPKFFDKSR